MIPRQIQKMAYDDAIQAIEILERTYPDMSLQLQAHNITEDRSSEVEGDATYWVEFVFACKGEGPQKFINQNWEYVIQDNSIYSCGDAEDLAKDVEQKMTASDVLGASEMKKSVFGESFEVTDETEIAETELKKQASQDIEDLIDQSSKNYRVSSIDVGDHSDGLCDVKVKLLDDSGSECDAVLYYEILDDGVNLTNTKDVIDFLNDCSVTSATFIAGSPIMAEEDFPSMNQEDIDLGDPALQDDESAEDQDQNEETTEFESDTIMQDDPSIDTDNNIVNHYIAECDVCHGIFISAVVESDQVIDHISGMCPLCQKDSDQKLKWIIKSVDTDEMLK